MEETKQTAPEETQTGSTEAATEGQNESQEAATGAGDQQSSDKKADVKEDDVNNLVRDRDRNFTRAETAEEKLNRIEASLAMRDAVDSLQKEFPEVPRSVLENAGGYESAKIIAAEFTKVKEQAKQDALKDLQTVNEAPPLSAEDRAAQLKEAKEKGDFDKFLEIQMS